jgi:hypothetical protein
MFDRGRREFITLLGGMAVASPGVVRAQQPAMPVIGFLRSTTSLPFLHLTTAFRQSLTEAGFVEGQSLAIEYRYADNQHDRLPALAGDLVRRQVAAIVCNGDAALATKAAASSIPIVFVTGDDPVRQGLVASLGRPTGNLTGVTFFGGGQLAAKRVELLRDLARDRRRPRECVRFWPELTLKYVLPGQYSLMCINDRCGPGSGVPSRPTFNEERNRSGRRSAAPPLGAVEDAPAARTDIASLAGHAGGDAPLVRNVIAAQPHSVALTGGALFRRALRGGTGTSRARRCVSRGHSAARAGPSC